MGDRYPVMKLGMIWPMPEQKIRDFAASVDQLIIVEELDGFIEGHCKNLGIDCVGKEKFSCIDELSQNKVAAALGQTTACGVKVDDAIPPRPPVMCAGCPHRGLFYTLKKNKLTVIGDIGCYTLGAVAPLQAVDTVICMGASVSGIHGFCKSQNGAADNKTVAVIGDSTFMHSGITGLVNMAYNESNATVIIVDNSITGMTGHQQNPTTGFNLKGDPCAKIDLETLCRAVGIKRVRVVDPYDLQQCDTAIKEELAANEPSVIISRRPCALLKYVKHKAPLAVDSDKCVGCKACMKIGCPAISMVDGKARVDATQCVGCGVCEQLCKFGALKEV
jgi:indolepyruvate ferredoxin oxidoreductase alpha subunit